MALIQVNFISKSLLRTVTANVILPVDKFSLSTDAAPAPRKTFKTLYLLHGIFGNHTDWVSGTNIQRLAEAKDLAVVMPSGENGFYVDQPETGRFYGEFIGRELVDVTRRMFPLSERREDTFLGGLSMGGYGALRNGLKYCDTFGRILSFSGALHILEDVDKREPSTVAFEKSCFGDLKAAARTDANPRVLIERLAAGERAALPRVFMSCGTEDSLLPVNRTYRDLLREKGFDVTYLEGPGGHEWDFWGRTIRDALEWLPLGADDEGLNSGHIDG